MSEAIPENWAFDDPPNVAVLTVASILDGSTPIGLVSHNADDGAWQFLPFEGVGSDDLSIVRLVALREICELDPSVVELAGLPLGWRAFRRGPNEAWILREDTEP